MAGMKGGDRLMARLQGIADRMQTAGASPSVKVGFLAGATYPDGTPIAYVAAINEFGATIPREAGEVTIYRKVAAAGTHFLRQGRFVARKDANFASTHAHGAYTITIPPRPFFRTMIKERAKTWPAAIEANLKATAFDAAKTLTLMGEIIKGQLQQAIQDFRVPGNAPSTIRKKGFDKPLVHTRVMWRSVDFKIST
jgi:hypothetical protein